MNQLPTKQNTEKYQCFLRAASERYRRSKRLGLWQVCLTVAVPVVLSVAAAVSPEIDPIAALGGLGILFVDLLGLGRARERARHDGALVQELFDCGLYGLGWNSNATGEEPPHEVVEEWANRLPKDARDGLIDWYPNSVGALPLQAARVVCQRLNSIWDSNLRLRYAWYVTGGILAILTALLLFGFLADPSISTLALKATILSPAFAWALREWQAQMAVVKALKHLEGKLEELWDAIVAGTSGEQELLFHTRSIQDQIFAQRRDGPEGIEWVYNLFRGNDQREMNTLASELVREYLEARGSE